MNFAGLTETLNEIVQGFLPTKKVSDITENQLYMVTEGLRR